MLHRSFWYITIPVMAVVLPIALWGDIKKMVHYLQKRLAAKHAVKVSPIDLCVDFDLEFSIIADLQAGLIVDSLPPRLPPYYILAAPFIFSYFTIHVLDDMVLRILICWHYLLYARIMLQRPGQPVSECAK